MVLYGIPLNAKYMVFNFYYSSSVLDMDDNAVVTNTHEQF